MKLYSLALLFAFAAAQDAEAEPAAEEPAAEEEEVEEVKKLGGPVTWDSEADLVDGVAGTFSANVSYMEDADGLVAVESSAEGTWGEDTWPDLKKNASNYDGGIILVFRQEEAADDATIVHQEGWMAVGTRGAEGNGAGVISATWQQSNFAADFTYETFGWASAPSGAEVTTDFDAPNWTEGAVSFSHTGASGSANRAGAGVHSSFKDGEAVTVWGGVWTTNKGATSGGHWGAATMTWDLEKPDPKPVENTEEVEEGASRLAMTALAGAALAALAF